LKDKDAKDEVEDTVKVHPDHLTISQNLALMARKPYQDLFTETEKAFDRSTSSILSVFG
jgi:hypothetical protein